METRSDRLYEGPPKIEYRGLAAVSGIPHRVARGWQARESPSVGERKYTIYSGGKWAV